MSPMKINDTLSRSRNSSTLLEVQECWWC